MPSAVAFVCICFGKELVRKACEEHSVALCKVFSIVLISQHFPKKDIN